MNEKQAGSVNGRYQYGKKDCCGHQRLVDDHYEHGEKTGSLMCRECGAVLQDDVKAAHGIG